jgi:putative ABC transport system permease protein
VNLAYHDVRHRVGRFVGTSLGIALLFTVVLAMAGIYLGLVDDATILLRSMRADVWVVQQGTRGPFADASRLDPSIVSRVSALPGVTRARAFTYQVLQRAPLAREPGRSLRMALVGLDWPIDRGDGLPIVRGRALRQAHGELVADATLGLAVGDVLHFAREEFRVVGLTKQVLSSGGDAMVFGTLADAQLIADDAPSDAIRAERERRTERLRATDLGRSQPQLEALTDDPEFHPPVLPSPPIAAVLVEIDAPASLERVRLVREALAAWPDVTAYTTREQEQLLLDGAVEKPRKQLALFSAILVITSSLLIGAVVYMMTLDKTHDIAVLKLMGASTGRLAGMVLQQAWAMGALGFAIAVAIGQQAFPHFPRRVVLTTEATLAVGALVMVISTLGSLLAIRHAVRVDAGKALEG